MKLPVTKCMDEIDWLWFEEADIRRECTVACGAEMTGQCIDGMKTGGVDCVTAYLNLTLTKCDFIYKPLESQELPKEG